MRTPPRPFGASPRVVFDQWVYDSIVSLAPKHSPGILTDHTTRGVFRRAQFSNGGGSFPPPGIELRELSVCVRNDDGTTEEMYIRAYCTVIYKKDGGGDPIDRTTEEPLDLPPTTGNA
jgi:hypothetical protein